jgi:hypothetical protein
MRSISYALSVTIGLTLLVTVSNAQIVIDNSLTPQQLVEDVLVGSGVQISNITFSGQTGQIGAFDASNSTFPISEGLVMSSGDVATIPGAGGDFSSTPYGQVQDPDLDLISSAFTRDATVLQFDFVPVGDTVRFNYIFGSEEYPEFVNGGFNDVFAFIISGPGFNGPFSNGGVNIALLPGSNTPVTIDNVNDGVNSQYYVDNSNGGVNGIVFDGYTVVLTALAQVECGETYTLKLAIADAGDNAYDSGVFLEARSFYSNAIEIQIATLSGDSAIVEGCTNAAITFSRPLADTLVAVPVFLGGNAINGVDFEGIPDTVVFQPGETTVSFTVSALEDGLLETTQDTIILTIYSLSVCGDTIESVGVIYIKEDYELNITLTNELIGCAGLYTYSDITSMVSGGNPPYYYQWSNGETTPGIAVAPPVASTYTLTVTDSCGVGSQTISISVPASVSAPSPSITTSNNVVLDCPGETASLTAIAAGGTPPYIYTWSGGLNGSTINVQPGQTIDYVVAVTDACFPGPVRDTINVTVLPYTPPTIAVSDTSVLCPGNDLLVEVIIENGNAPINVVWSNGLSGLTNTLNPTEDTFIIIVATDACGTNVEDVLDLTVAQYEPLTASIRDTITSAADIVTICELWADTLWVDATGGFAPYVYQWTGSLISPLVVGNDSIELRVPYELTPDSVVTELYTVTVTDQCGVQTTVEVTVAVISCDIVQPNIFNPESIHFGASDFCGSTPQNNVFTLPCLELYPGNKMTIFDRWGRNRYEKENYHLEPWNGDGAADGVYFYVLEIPGRTELLKGFFHLAR